MSIRERLLKLVGVSLYPASYTAKRREHAQKLGVSVKHVKYPWLGRFIKRLGLLAAIVALFTASAAPIAAYPSPTKDRDWLRWPMAVRPYKYSGCSGDSPTMVARCDMLAQRAIRLWEEALGMTLIKPKNYPWNHVPLTVYVSQAQFENRSPSTGGVTFMDPSNCMIFIKPSAHDQLRLYTHEVGHCLGLGDVEGASHQTVMAVDNFDFVISPESVELIQNQHKELYSD